MDFLSRENCGNFWSLLEPKEKQEDLEAWLSFFTVTAVTSQQWTSTRQQFDNVKFNSRGFKYWNTHHNPSGILHRYSNHWNSRKFSLVWRSTEKETSKHKRIFHPQFGCYRRNDLCCWYPARYGGYFSPALAIWGVHVQSCVPISNRSDCNSGGYFNLHGYWAV